MGCRGPGLSFPGSPVYSLTPADAGIVRWFWHPHEREQSHDASMNQEGTKSLEPERGTRQGGRPRGPSASTLTKKPQGTPTERRAGRRQCQGSSRAHQALRRRHVHSGNMMLDAANGDVLERDGKGQGHRTRAVTNAGMTATSAATAAVQLSICRKIAARTPELVTPALTAMAPRSLEEASLTWNVKLARTAAKDMACLTPSDASGFRTASTVILLLCDEP